MLVYLLLYIKQCLSPPSQQQPCDPISRSAACVKWLSQRNSLIGLWKSQTFLEEAIEKLSNMVAEDDMLNVYFPLVLFWTHYFIEDTLYSCIAVGMFVQVFDLTHSATIGSAAGHRESISG